LTDTRISSAVSSASAPTAIAVFERSRAPSLPKSESGGRGEESATHFKGMS